jgi:hypothetical protein
MLPSVSVDLEGCFATGQVYVSLRRACPRQGLQIVNFTPEVVKTSVLAKGFYASLDAQAHGDVCAYTLFLEESADLWWHPVLNFPAWLSLLLYAQGNGNASKQFLQRVQRYIPTVTARVGQERFCCPLRSGTLGIHLLLQQQRLQLALPWRSEVCDWWRARALHGRWSLGWSLREPGLCAPIWRCRWSYNTGMMVWRQRASPFGLSMMRGSLMSKVNGEREKGLKEIVVCMPAETQQHIPVATAGIDRWRLAEQIRSRNLFQATPCGSPFTVFSGLRPTQ